jgi:D-alanyl-D-alanine dipeptidase
MPLVAIAPPEFDVILDLRYATADNPTGRPIYARAAAYLHPEAAALLQRAIELARPLGYRFKIFDAFRPVEAQWQLWHAFPSDEFVADPRRGSPHSRGAAVDLTLIDRDGAELEMGTAFDAFTAQAHHGRTDVSVTAQRNRALLLGLMTAAGWDFFKNEWWHYQLFQARQRLPLLSDSALPEPLMAPAAAR